MQHVQQGVENGAQECGEDRSAALPQDGVPRERCQAGRNLGARDSPAVPAVPEVSDQLGDVLAGAELVEGVFVHVEPLHHVHGGVGAEQRRPQLVPHGRVGVHDRGQLSVHGGPAVDQLGGRNRAHRRLHQTQQEGDHLTPRLVNNNNSMTVYL